MLELLALPLTDEFRKKRAEGLHGVRNILWSVGGGGAAAIAGGFTREDFMNEAFQHMTAAEQVVLHLLVCLCLIYGFYIVISHFSKTLFESVT